MKASAIRFAKSLVFLAWATSSAHAYELTPGARLRRILLIDGPTAWTHSSAERGRIFDSRYLRREGRLTLPDALLQEFTALPTHEAKIEWLERKSGGAGLVRYLKRIFYEGSDNTLQIRNLDLLNSESWLQSQPTLDSFFTGQGILPSSLDEVPVLSGTPNRQREQALRLHGSGALSTLEFLEIYPSTPLNQNRKRAAQVYRMLLCDPMEAGVPLSDEADLSIQLVARQSNRSAQPHADPARLDPHASAAQCMTCHSKIDPLARAFTPWVSNRAWAPVSAPAQLVYKTLDGGYRTLQGRGLGELLRQAVQTPEYRKCQVKRLAEFVFGKDRSLSEERLQELERDFDRFGRKALKFYYHLLLQPELFQLPDSELRQARRNAQHDWSWYRYLPAATSLEAELSSSYIQGVFAGFRGLWMDPSYRDNNSDSAYRRVPFFTWENLEELLPQWSALRNRSYSSLPEGQSPESAIREAIAILIGPSVLTEAELELWIPRIQAASAEIERLRNDLPDASTTQLRWIYAILSSDLFLRY
jgi:hypothetical protein